MRRVRVNYGQHPQSPRTLHRGFDPFTRVPSTGLSSSSQCAAPAAFKRRKERPMYECTTGVVEFQGRRCPAQLKFRANGNDKPNCGSFSSCQRERVSTHVLILWVAEENNRYICRLSLVCSIRPRKTHPHCDCLVLRNIFMRKVADAYRYLIAQSSPVSF